MTPDLAISAAAVGNIYSIAMFLLVRRYDKTENGWLLFGALVLSGGGVYAFLNLTPWLEVATFTAACNFAIGASIACYLMVRQWRQGEGHINLAVLLAPFMLAFFAFGGLL